MTRLRVVRLAGAALIAASATLAFSAVAGANDHQPAPDSGDDRAVVFGDQQNATTCADIGLSDATFISGDALVADGHASLDNAKMMVTITSVPDGMTITAIVVKGGDGYNLYEPGKRGLDSSLPYTDLHSPLVGQNENIPTISHWFVCGTQAETTGGGDTGGGDTGGGDTGGTTGGTETGSTGGTHQQTAVDAATPPAANADSDQLANTGFDATMPTILALVLLLVGTLMVLTPAQALALVGRLRRR